MSSHSPAIRARHADPKAYLRERFAVGTVTVEVVDHPETGPTFAVIAGAGPRAESNAPLYTGMVRPGMGTELRRLAHRIDDIEDALRARRKGGA